MHLTSAFGNNDMMTQAFKILMLLRTTFTLFYFDSPLAKEGKGGGLRPKKKKKDNTSSSYFVGSLVQQYSYIKILKFMKISVGIWFAAQAQDVWDLGLMSPIQ